MYICFWANLPKKRTRRIATRTNTARCNNLYVGKGLVPFLKPVEVDKYEEGVKPPPYIPF